MKERPILFSAPMVRALLDGSKTQTRRAIKLPPAPDHLGEWKPTTIGGFGITDARGIVVPEIAAIWHTRTGKTISCPYGQPGDRLWVRETWAQNWNQLSDTRMDLSYVYRADGETRALDNGTELPWRPSIHMTRAASRIDLEVTGIRVERLQDIGEEDAKAEGCERAAETTYDDDRLNAECGYFPPSSYAHGYRLLWQSINGAGSWAANPWVWVVEFRRVTR